MPTPFDMRTGGAYLPPVKPISAKEVARRYNQCLNKLKRVALKDIKARCNGCGHVDVRGFTRPVPMRLLTKMSGLSASAVRRAANQNNPDGYYACDACVNAWGFSMCGCGSGKHYLKCHGGYDTCGCPMILTQWK